MSWENYCQAVHQLGFSKVTIVNRETYHPVGHAPRDAVATSYMDGNIRINENQELADNWKSKKRTTFRFYGSKFTIVKRDEADGKWLIGERENGFIVAKAFKSVWFIAFARRKSEKSKLGFNSAQEAFDTINKELWSTVEGEI
ncbi:hypothetical protein RFI_30629 [Reticulomyxa filosa]|uniref:Profilin n=1 Tax=Reticulomyxa filosa TaxID=46433 RepID=X6LXV1_RETFI|nr:hypothetical protein RFI_30629 [Reticulomyxa filosa]|eukprot:ETO06763.1 hypothetical protein RFI_30629 [Reticulomyxa filosa]